VSPLNPLPSTYGSQHAQKRQPLAGDGGRQSGLRIQSDLTPMAPNPCHLEQANWRSLPRRRERSLKVLTFLQYMLVSGVPVTYRKTEDSLTIR